MKKELILIAIFLILILGIIGVAYADKYKAASLTSDSGNRKATGEKKPSNW
jgi:uncharacterized protein YpmB